MFATNRTIRAAVLAAAAAAVALTTAGTAAGDTVTVNSRGTGQPLPGQLVTQTPDGVVVENDGPNQIAPLPGHKYFYNQSLNIGDRKGGKIVRKYAEPGDTVICKGYSLGGEIAGDTCDELFRDDEGNEFTIETDTNADPRLRGTGVAVVYKQYTDMLPNGAYPYVHFRGERKSQGKTKYLGKCAEYDIICNAADLRVNPFGAAAGFFGYLDDQHNYSDVDRYPTRVVTYDGGYTVITVVDKGNPLVKYGDIASTVVTGKPMSDAQESLVEALSPAPTPGSRVQVTPDVKKVAPAAGKVTEETYQEYAPKVVNKVVDAGVTQVTGNPVVGNVAGNVAQKVAEPIVTATAPVVNAGVTAATESLMSGNPSAINKFANGVVPGLNLPVHP